MQILSLSAPRQHLRRPTALRTALSLALASLFLQLPLSLQAAPAGSSNNGENKAPPSLSVLTPLPHQGRTAHLSAEVLTRFHYAPLTLNDDMSEKIFDRYLKALDGNRSYFLQADIDRLSLARQRLDDAILTEDLRIPFAIFNVYSQRAWERFTYARQLLKSGFEFDSQERYVFRRDKAPWPASTAELNELWRQRVKNDWLQLKLNGKDDKSIAETLDKRYENALKRLARAKSEDVFQSFMNAYSMSIEPHTNYLGPSASADFDIAMKLSLVGIGASLEEKDDYTLIRELIPGSPAARSGLLKPGDRILGVAQGEDGPLVDVVGWRLDDTVQLIRGNADTTVVLDILPADENLSGPHKRISLVRKKVSLEEQAAKKSVLTLPGNETDPNSPYPRAYRLGVISLPSFYEDFAAKSRGEKDYRSATRDIAKLLAELKREKVDGVVMDLRNNGGGSLNEAVDLTGLFIETGPVVMQRNNKGDVTVGEDKNANIAWDGPLVVLINHNSASASEIFAGAIQDYRRGLIVGEPSFGKGTVQTIVDLDRLMSPKGNDKKLGDLKLTIAQFFRISGASTQLKGVTPDVALPTLADLEHSGEAANDNALPWTQIEEAHFRPLNDFSSVLPGLLARHNARLSSDPALKRVQEDVAEIERLRKQDSLSLNEAVRRDEQAARDARNKARKEAEQAEKAQEKATSKTEKAEKPESQTTAHGDNNDADTPDDDEGQTELAGDRNKDVFLKETARVLADELELAHRAAAMPRNHGGHRTAKAE